MFQPGGGGGVRKGEEEEEEEEEDDVPGDSSRLFVETREKFAEWNVFERNIRPRDNV